MLYVTRLLKNIAMLAMVLGSFACDQAIKNFVKLDAQTALPARTTSPKTPAIPPTQDPSLAYALGVLNNNTLIVKQINKLTGAAKTIQSFALAGSFSDFQLVKNNTRILVQVDGYKLYHYGLDNTTSPPTISLLSSAQVPTAPGGMGGICAPPDGTSAHLVAYSSNIIYSFKVSATDQVSYVGLNNQVPDYVVDCRVTQNSKYLLAAGFNQGAASFSIDSTTGALIKLMSAPSGNGPAWIEQSEDSQFFFVPSQNDDSVQAFHVDLATGLFNLVDTLSLPGAGFDFIDVRANGTHLYIDGQSGSVYHLTFDRTTMKFGSSSIVSNITDWFTLDKLSNFYFQNKISNTNIMLINADGSLSATPTTFTSENNFHTYSF
jgi:hypothetical protein